MSKGQADKVLSGLANPCQGEEASGPPNAHQHRDPPPLFPGNHKGKTASRHKSGHKDTHARHT